MVILITPRWRFNVRIVLNTIELLFATTLLYVFPDEQDFTILIHKSPKFLKSYVHFYI